MNDHTHTTQHFFREAVLAARADVKLPPTTFGSKFAPEVLPLFSTNVSMLLGLKGKAKAYTIEFFFPSLT